MKRRHLLQGALGGASIAWFASNGLAQNAGTSVPDRLPKREPVRVAFMLGENANMIDTAGPWEVFQDATIMDGDHHRSLFELCTVAPTAGTLRMTGGLEVKPQYTIESAPQPHVIVVPAHRATDASRAWLKQASAKTDVTVSICTGAFQLARAGLLKGVPATTHHDFWDSFSKEFPDVELKRGLRFVDSGRIATAGGLTSGIDLALHIVSRYFGAEVAEAAARYMEYSSDAWRVPRAAALEKDPAVVPGYPSSHVEAPYFDRTEAGRRPVLVI
jgi:transcriptional regulator GlxA family with amidase domain